MLLLETDRAVVVRAGAPQTLTLRAVDAAAALRETQEEGYDKNGLRIQAKDADEGVLTTEFGVQVGGASTMGILRGFDHAVESDPDQLTV